MRAGELEQLAQVVEAFGARHSSRKKVVFDLHLALEEVFTNVVSYAYEGGAPRPVVVRLTRAGEELRVEVEDEGHPFNPLELAPPDLSRPLEERSVGGLGIFLVRQAMDTLEYRREDGRNVLVMTRRATA